MEITLQDKAVQVMRRVEELCRLAERKFNITMPHVQVNFNLRGAAAGKALRVNGKYEVRFNATMMNGEGWDHIINNTVPHEVAHIICFYTGWDHGHGKYWALVCNALGGNAQRCHSEKVIYARGRTFLYTTTKGHKITVSQTLHNRIQAGQIRDGGKRGQIHRHCAYEVIN